MKFSCHAAELDFLEAAPERIVNEVSLAASADAVFEIIPPGGDLMVLGGDLQADAFVTLHELDG